LRQIIRGFAGWAGFVGFVGFAVDDAVAAGEVPRVVEGALTEVDGAAAGGGKTRGVRTTPGGTAVGVCQGRHVGAAAGAFPATAALRAESRADEAAYAVVTPATSGRSASATPAACTGRLRRR
jgi:hypothetical protein